MKKSIQIIALTIFFSMIGVLFSAPISATDIPTSVTIKPSLGLTLSSSSVVLNLDPTTNPFDNETVNIVVGTNNPTGYWVTMSSNNNDTSLINTNDTTKTIPTLVSNTSEADFPANHWGYKVSNNSGTGDSNTDYLPYVSGATIASNNTKVNNDTTNLTIASKIDYLSVPGLYKQTFNFTALPHITNYYMQDLSNPTLAQEVCRTDAPSIVMDKRDEHPYLIQRLADNHCWMLDNLDLDLTNESIVANLTTENTNIDTTNDPNALDYLKNGGGTASDKYAILGLEYHNWTGPGMTPLSPSHSYSQPLVNRSGKCDPSKNTTTAHNWPCAGKWQDASYTNNTVIDTADTSNTKYNYGPGSYKIGTYYNYCAASAGTYCYGNGINAGIPPENSSPTSDICPAGWHIPSSNSSSNGDYRTLCSAIKGSDCTGVNTMVATDPTSLQYQLSMPISGAYSDGTAYRQGHLGLYISSTYYNERFIYTFSNYLSEVSFPSNARNMGMFIRCVSP
ncbi:hypothetical protein IKF23_04040 [Candidatus Saccharibacteria bacterium]|nr:hypothetical protein [Candidatus Saccharibacteria bacterium]